MQWTVQQMADDVMFSPTILKSPLASFNGLRLVMNPVKSSCRYWPNRHPSWTNEITHHNEISRFPFIVVLISACVFLGYTLYLRVIYITHGNPARYPLVWHVYVREHVQISWSSSGYTVDSFECRLLLELTDIEEYWLSDVLEIGLSNASKSRYSWNGNRVTVRLLN